MQQPSANYGHTYYISTYYVSGGMTASSEDPKPEDDAPPTHCHLPDCPWASQILGNLGRVMTSSAHSYKPRRQLPGILAQPSPVAGWDKPKSRESTIPRVSSPAVFAQAYIRWPKVVPWRWPWKQMTKRSAPTERGWDGAVTDPLPLWR